MKIIVGRTIVLIKPNSKLALVIEKYLNKWTVGDWTLEESYFIPIFQLRKEANLGRYTPEEIVEKHKLSIMSTLIKKTASLANKNDKLTDENTALRAEVSEFVEAKPKRNKID